MGVIAYFRTEFHRLNLADFVARTPFPAFGHEWLARHLNQQAAILGFDYPFLVAAAVFILLAGLVWLANPVHLPVRLRRRTLTRWLRLAEVGRLSHWILLILPFALSGCAGLPDEGPERRFLAQPALTHSLQHAAGAVSLTGVWPRRD